MKKKVFSFLLMAIAMIAGTASAFAQEMPQLTPLPEMPGLRTGKLPNGLTYYVLRNTEPKGRANFYIAQKVGSTLETPEQLGLAHFLEHMAFNGTKNYPGKTMLNYLQGKGIRFGADINAYTDFDETVYNIDNVPTSDKNLVDSVLLVLHDWSCNLLLEDDEIEAERGVIQEEWRSRNDAQDRVYKAMLPAVFEEYQYQQSPIGTMDVVMNFKPEVLRDYYHRWYRPDQQGIVVVGDFDAEEMEKKVVDLFSGIKMPEGAPERTYAVVSDNEQPIYFEFADPELGYPIVRTAFKTDRVPFEYRNTAEMYINHDLLQQVLSRLINNRLEEYSHEPDCKYRSAGVYFGQYFVSKTKEGFFCNVIPKDNVVDGYRDAMSVIIRACKTGFTDSELERVNSEIISAYEKYYNERDKTGTDDLAKELIRHFVENVPAPGIEAEYQIVSNILPQIPVQQINMVASMLLTPNNQVITVTLPQTDPWTLPGKEKMLTLLNELLNAEYEAYQDTPLTEPLFKSEPVAGKIASEVSGEKFGTTIFTLSNGVRVVVKPTDFSNDEILVRFWSEDGLKYYPVAEAIEARLLGDAYEISKIGNYNVKDLTKYISGKQIALGIGLGQSTFTVSGKSTVKDLPTLMELLYASMTQVSPDDEQWNMYKEQLVRSLKLMANNPDFIWSVNRTKAMWGNNPMMNTPTVEEVEKCDYHKVVEMIQKATSNAADFTMVLVGNVDVATLRPLLEKYVASLPSTGKKTERKVLTPIALPAGNQEDVFDVKMQTPTVQVYGVYDGSNLDYNVANDAQIDILGDVLSNIYTLTLREEEGGTYSPGAAGQMYPSSHQWGLLYLFTTNSEVGGRLQERAHKEAMDLLNNGAKTDMFNQVREAALNQLKINERTNGYWAENLIQIERGFDLVSGREEFLKDLTVEKFNAFIKGIYDGKNSIKVVMNGVAAE